MSVVHVLKGRFWGQKHLDGRCADDITAFLFHTGGHEDPIQLESNADQSFQGSIVLGMGFTFDDADKKGIATPLAEMQRICRENPRGGEVIFPYIGGKELNSSPTHDHHRYVINFAEYPLERADVGSLWQDAGHEECKEWLRSGIVPLDYPGPVAADWPHLLEIVRRNVKPHRDKLGDGPDARRRKNKWWLWGRYTPGLFDAIADLDRAVAVNCGATPHLALAFLPAAMVFANSLVIFPLDTHAAFCALQSRPHEIWARFFGSTLEDRLRYTPSDVFETFPFPQNWTTDPTLEAIGEAYYDFRADLMIMNNEGLTKTYNRFHDPDERDPDIAELRTLHAAMDRAVLDAYGWTDIPTDCDFLPEHEDDGDDGSSRRKKRYRYRWPDPVRDEVLGRLIELNAERAEEERRAASEE